MLVWKKSIEVMPPHQHSVFGWNTKNKTWIRDIWWDENDGTWNTDDQYFEKDEISHWMEHPSAPDGELESVVAPTTEENPCKEIAVERLTADVPDDADLDWWLDDQMSKMDDASRANILAVPTPDGMSRFGFFTGMSVRNYYGLWHENGLTRYFNNVLGVYHADDMSGVLLEALWYRVHDKQYDPSPLIERYRKHWENSGCSMKGEKLSA